MFSTFPENFLSLSSNLVCCQQNPSVWKSLEFVAWERIKIFFSNKMIESQNLNFPFGRDDNICSLLGLPRFTQCFQKTFSLRLLKVHTGVTVCDDEMTKL